MGFCLIARLFYLAGVEQDRYKTITSVSGCNDIGTLKLGHNKDYITFIATLGFLPECFRVPKVSC